SCVEINEREVITRDKSGKETALPADTVVIAAGLKPLTEETEKLRGYTLDFIPVGDCKRAKLILEAVRSGYDAALNL
ncbi:MAG: hypothetical protein LBO21_00350, partial [Synergistaceae bacterium]|nr:hypothetical protein [Synergistaceae bacterium]